MKQTIYISGTPTTGKTTISEKLSEEIGAKLIKINDFVFKHNLTLGKDAEKGYEIIDIEKLDKTLQKEIENHNGITIVEGHTSHLCTTPDVLIILRTHPDILNKRLEDRGYSKDKIRENLEAEAIGVCSYEAFEIHGDVVTEVDISDLTIDESVSLLKDIINGEKNYPVGNVDFMDWLISQ